jgi:hypothetical protein
LTNCISTGKRRVTSACLRPYFHCRIWVECAYNLRLRRGIERDGEAMRSQWVHIWMPAEDRYVEDERPDTHAHLVVDGAGAGTRKVMVRVAKRAHGSSAEQRRGDDRDNRC